MKKKALILSLMLAATAQAELSIRYITHFVDTNGVRNFTWGINGTETNHTYVLVYSTTLDHPIDQWAQATSHFPGEEGEIVRTVRTPTNSFVRFYGVRDDSDLQRTIIPFDEDTMVTNNLLIPPGLTGTNTPSGPE